MELHERLGRQWQGSHGLPGEYDPHTSLFTLMTKSGLLLGWTPYAFGQLRIKMIRPSQEGELPEILREL